MNKMGWECTANEETINVHTFDFNLHVKDNLIYVSADRRLMAKYGKILS